MISPLGSGPEALGPREKPERDYSIELVGKTIDVLDTLKRRSDLRLTEIAEAIRQNKTTTFRILYTLERRGYVVRDPRSKRFRLSICQRQFRVGYAQPMAGHHFGDRVTESLVKEAERRDIELIVLDNRWDAEVAIKNARKLAQQKVDFAIEFQLHHEVAPVIAQIFAKAGVPTMALGIPQPGAIYFGGNNYEAGLLSGQALAQHALSHWDGRLDRLIGVDNAIAGRQMRHRVIGALKAIQKAFPAFSRKQMIHVDAAVGTEGVYRAVRKILRSVPKCDRLGIACVNDEGAWGALRAVRDAGRERSTAIMGMGFDGHPSFVEEMRKPKSPLIGTVAWFPEKYGPQVLSLVMRWLGGEQVPPEVEHGARHGNPGESRGNARECKAHDGSAYSRERSLVIPLLPGLALAEQVATVNARASLAKCRFRSAIVRLRETARADPGKVDNRNSNLDPFSGGKPVPAERRS